MKTIYLWKFIILLLIVSSQIQAQNQPVKVGIVGNKISDFTLPTYQGEVFSMNKMMGKNVLLIVSRGKYAENGWCTICYYQYADFADLELKDQIQKKYNLEIVFLLPYGKDTMAKWERQFPIEIANIEKWKNPEKPDSLTARQKEWMLFARANYPKNFDFTGKKLNLPFPILMDETHEISKGLDLFRTEWGKSKAEQNIPAVYIIDKNGIIQFKYISQNTTDRPTSNYILEMIEKLCK
jgi:peroxiredoxin